ncbi:unnamed protein product [Caenorhabditis brenneri]
MSNNQYNYHQQNYPPPQQYHPQSNSNYPPNPQYYPQNQVSFPPPPPSWSTTPRSHPQSNHYQNPPNPPTHYSAPFPPQSPSYYPHPAPPQNFAPPPPPPQEVTNIHGLVIGRTKQGERNWLFYSAGLKKGIVEIRRQGPNPRVVVSEMRIGQWMELTIYSPNFNGEFLLDRTNSYGYDVEFDDSDILPDPQFCSAKFFPARANLEEGELVVIARFGMRTVPDSRKLEMISYDIEYKHLIDDYSLIRNSHPAFDGRSFLVELQASVRGWVVLKVHEDHKKQLLCDSRKFQLPNAIVDFNVQFLEDCDPKLPDIMTGTGILQPFGTTQKQQQQQLQLQQHHVPGSVGQNQTNTSTGGSSSHRLQSEYSDVSVAAATPTILEHQKRAAQATMTTTTNSTTTTTTRKEERPGEKRTGTPAPKPPRSIQNKKPDGLDEMDVVEDESNAEKEITHGTYNMPNRRFLKDVSGKTYERFQSERARKGEQEETALCTVVQKFEGMCLLYTAKKDVLNVLLYEKKCEGVKEPLHLGQCAFFRILPRQNETQDELLPRAPYTHIAVRMKEVTPESQEKITFFQQSVRCYGGLVEMCVKIKLTQGGKVFFHYEDDDQIRSDEDRRFYYLKATNGVLVTIPCQRIITLLNKDLSADFDLVAWVTHRRAVGNVSLHIGKIGKAYREFKDGTMRELEPVCTHWQSGGRK